MRRIEVSPAALGSLALHVGVAVAMMVHLGSRELKVGSVVPVTIVSNAPPAPPPPAVQGPEELPAQAEEPTPEPVPPAPEPPAPQPKPTPPPPKPTPAPAPTPPPPPKAAPTPKAAQPAPKPVQKGLDLDALDASLAPSQPTGGRASNATKGPPRAATSPTPRDTVGDKLAAAQADAGLVEELQRRWNPNCEVEGGRDVLVRVTFVIGAGGGLSGTPSAEIRSARNDVAEAAAERAVRAVYAASPFRTLPREFYGRKIVNFIAREACSIR